MAAGVVFARNVKQFLQRLVFDSANPLLRDVEFSLPVFLDISLFDQQFDNVGMLFLPLFEMIEHVRAVIEHVFAELIEQSICRLRSKLLRSVPAGIFKLGHDEE